MSLREHLKNTLSSNEPLPEEASKDLKVVLGRAEPRGRPWLWASAFAGAAGIAYFFLRTPAGASTFSYTDVDGIHLYLLAEGESETRAISIDLDLKGALQP